MDSITQIVLGAAVGEAVAGKKMGGKAALWGAIAGTIPDLDVFARAFVHPIDGALIHRGFSHSLVFALLMSPLLGWLLHRLYKKKYEQKTWTLLFFLAIVTHPMLDIFTNYGTQFLWPFNYRLTFNSVFVIDPLYTIPFMILLTIALFFKRTNKWRFKLNMIGIIYSTTYLLWCVIVKLTVLNNSDAYFESAGIKGKNNLVTPMPFTSFYWMMITEDKDNFYIGYKSLFYRFDHNDIDIIKKNKKEIHKLKWKDKDYSKMLKHITTGYYAIDSRSIDTIKFYDLRFGVPTQMTEGKVKTPIMGYGMVIDNGFVKKTEGLRSKGLWEHVNFDAYLYKVFKK